jgi:hypothetical protein
MYAQNKYLKDLLLLHKSNMYLDLSILAQDSPLDLSLSKVYLSVSNRYAFESLSIQALSLLVESCRGDGYIQRVLNYL